jgi:3,4-dihydroxy 2-butanone 4-phosphate synthase/GTP cyclohydrolase II
MRSGHTEAAVDLCKLAGLPPIAVICELVNDDGTVTRGEQVDAFSVKHGLKQVSVADLIAYRQRKETLIEHIDSFDVETVAGKAKAFTYKLPWDPMHHLAVVFGDIRDGVDVPVRLHLESVVDDVFSKQDPMTAIMQPDGLGRPRRRGLSARGLGRRRQQASRRRRMVESARTMPKRRRARTSGWKSVWAHRF